MNIKTADQSLDHVFAGEQVEKRIVETVTSNFDEALASGASGLTQHEDVRTWVKNPAMIQKIQPSLADFTRMLRLHGGNASVLDVGCYGGYVYDYLHQMNVLDFTYTGIDIHPEVIDAACHMHRDNKNASFRVCDLFKLEQEMAPRAFDFVICSRVLVQVPFFQRALRNLYTVAGKAVMVILAISDTSHADKFERTNVATGKSQHVWFRYFTVKELDEAAQALGADFRVIQGPRPYASYVLYR